MQASKFLRLLLMFISMLHLILHVNGKNYLRIICAFEQALIADIALPAISLALLTLVSLTCLIRSLPMGVDEFLLPDLKVSLLPVVLNFRTDIKRHRFLTTVYYGYD